MGWIYLIISIIGSTVLWPVGRWATAGEGRATVLGFWTSLFCCLINALSMRIAGESFGTWQVWAASGLLSVAYSIGFCTLIMHCLKIGPAGPTATINNMAMVCGVVYGMLWLEPRTPNALVIVGVAGTCAALVLIGAAHRRGDRNKTNVPASWLPMVLIGGAFSGLSFMTQTYIGDRQPHSIYQYMTIAFGLSTLILFPVMLRHPELWSHSRERIGGFCIGSITGILSPLVVKAMGALGAAVVLPVAVTTPVILVLIIGHFVYHERLDRFQLAGSIVGIASVLLLAIGSAGH